MHNLKEKCLTCEKVVTVFDMFASCSLSLIAWGSFKNSIAPTDTHPEPGSPQNRGHLRPIGDEQTVLGSRADHALLRSLVSTAVGFLDCRLPAPHRDCGSVVPLPECLLLGLPLQPKGKQPHLQIDSI